MKTPDMYKNYIGRKVQLYPNDTYRKKAIVANVDELGWTFRITESQDPQMKPNTEYFVNHASRVTFIFIDENDA